MDRQPTLEGERLLLRPLRAGDWPALFAVAADPLIWEVHPANDRWQETVFRAFFADALAQGGAIVAIDRSSGAIVGSSRWQGHDPDASRVEIGWTFLARSHWGGAFNRELKRLMLAYAFRWVERVTFSVGEDNLRSRRAMEKIGGRLTVSKSDKWRAERRATSPMKSPARTSRGGRWPSRASEALAGGSCAHHQSVGFATISQNTPINPKNAGQPNANHRCIVLR